jgi:hypothetical protein
MVLKANFLIQILLPTLQANGEAVPRELFQEITSELTHRFGGLTAYTRAPAEGLWKDDGDKPVQDEIVIYEVMVTEVDAAWWKEYRRKLEERFDQNCVIVRAQAMQLL